MSASPEAEGVPSDFQAADTGAPILLVTGMPGAGKTNYVLHEFALHKRHVFQANIPGCKLPTFNPEDWPAYWESRPVDATFLIDEAREVFPPKSPTADAPPWYVLNRARHTGRRFVIICQHPNDIDARVRRLCGRHLHFKESFGGGSAEVYEWRQKIGDPDSTGDALRWKYKHDKAVFGLYKSTELHRGAAKKPWKVRAIPYIFVSIPLLLLLGVWWIWHRSQGMGSDISHGGLPGTGGKGSIESSAGGRDKPKSKAEYLAAFVPRVEGLAYTAPVYDEVTRPTEAPYPAACIYSESKPCRCFSQQGTRLEMPKDLCVSIADGGFFVAWSQKVAAAIPLSSPGPALPASVGGPAGFAFTPPTATPSASVLAPSRTEDLPPGRGRNLPPSKPN